MRWHSLLTVFLCLVLVTLATGCASLGERRTMTVTAYCGCGQCNGYTRGHWYLLKLDVWNRVNADGSPYTGRTASGDRLRLYHPGLVSADSLQRPWLIAPRLVFPWLWLEQDGTIAADTTYYPFGTRIHVPGWGWGRVEDRGSAIKGPDHIDIHLWRHGAAQDWGRPRLTVEIKRPSD